MKAVGLLGALGQEIKPLVQRVDKYERIRLGAFASYRFQISDFKCYLVESGMGARRARDAAHTIIEAVRPEILISFGVAGAVNDDLNIGDIVSGSGVYFLAGESLANFQPLAQLSTASQRAIAQLLKNNRTRLVSGTIITTPGAQPGSAQFHGFENPIVDMETASIAQVAQEHGIPLLALRAISDTPSMPLPFDIEEFVDDQANLHLAELIKSMLLHPQHIGAFLRLSKNVNQATDNLSKVLLAILGQSFPID